jgi:hypothetical protein
VPGAARRRDLLDPLPWRDDGDVRGIVLHTVRVPSALERYVIWRDRNFLREDARRADLAVADRATRIADPEGEPAWLTKNQPRPTSTWSPSSTS